MEWALGDEAGFTSEHQATRFIDAIEETISNFVPKKVFLLLVIVTSQTKF